MKKIVAILITLVLTTLVGMSYAQVSPLMPPPPTDVVDSGGSGDGGGSVVSVPARDARVAARVFASLEPSAWYEGFYSFTYIATDGEQYNAWGNFSAKCYGLELKIYRFTLGNEVVWDNEKDPLPNFPYWTKGTPTFIYTNLWGYDANGNPTVFGVYSTKEWKANEPFIYAISPAEKPVFIPFDLNGRSPRSVGIILDENGTYPQCNYNEWSGGFIVWVDPTCEYHYRVVDITNGNATLITGQFIYGQLPVQDPAGSALETSYQDGVVMVKFDRYGSYSPGSARFNTNVVDKGGNAIPAAVFVLDRGALAGQDVYVCFNNFAGRLEISLVSPDGSSKIFHNKIYNEPSAGINVEVPCGASYGVVLSFIKENVPIETPIDVPVPSLENFYLYIGQIGTGGKG